MCSLAGVTPPPASSDAPSLHPTAADGFAAGAHVYDAARPGYPAQALDLLAHHLGLGDGPRVIDLGAGTGKLTRELASRGAEVVAIEPVAAMRQQLERLLPDVDVRTGTAEAIPLEDRTADAVTAAQAFHWFDAPVALAEIHRVLRAGGWLATVFNRRDLTTPVQAALDHLLASYRADTPSWATDDWAEHLVASPLFDEVETATFPNRQHLDAAGLAARVASVSFVAKLDDRSRARVFAAVHGLFERSQQDGAVDLHYRTEVRVLRRVGS